MNKILKYIFSCLYFINIACFAQSSNERITRIQFGIDLAEFAWKIFESEKLGVELTADLDLKQNLFPVIETGWNTVKFKKDFFNYNLSGYFMRVGFNYNLLEYESSNDRDILYCGIRYAVSFYNHEVNEIQITDNYWGNHIGDIPQISYYGHWIEFVGGVRTEILKNVFLGWSLRLRFLVGSNFDKNLVPYIIPGFGRKSNTTSFGINYSVFYSLPIKK